jgi:hypothetical protein
MVTVISKHTGVKHTCKAEARHQMEGADIPCQDCKPVKYWMGTRPTRCDICNQRLISYFIDGATRGPWALMCGTCHKIHGRGLGLGLGQKYDLESLEKIG